MVLLSFLSECSQKRSAIKAELTNDFDLHSDLVSRKSVQKTERLLLTVEPWTGSCNFSGVHLPSLKKREQWIVQEDAGIRMSCSALLTDNFQRQSPETCLT